MSDISDNVPNSVEILTLDAGEKNIFAEHAN